MIKEQAIKDMQERCCICKRDALPSEEDCEKCYFPVAIESIEKQIPKKVIPNEFGGYYCPGCKAFWGTKYGNFIDTNYCPNCGQAIDWSV